MIGKILCKLGIHKWGAWSEPLEAIALVFIQRRQCQRCKRVQTLAHALQGYKA